MALSPEVLAKLRSNDAAQIRDALDEVRLAGAGAKGAAPVIVELLERGLPTALTEAAIDTLAELETPLASDALSVYVAHRTVGVRRAATKALARTKGPAAVRALRRALADADPQVRGFAATGLGAIGAREAVGDLFLALDRRVAEAGAALGRLCAGAECDTLVGKLGSLPLPVVTAGLDPLLFRPAGDVSDDIKVKVVGRVRELGTPEANKFLRDVQKRWPGAWSQRVKQAIDQAVLATGGGAP